MPKIQPEPQPSNTELIELLQTVYRAVDYMSDIDGQDRSLIVEMSQAMLNDLIETGTLNDMLEYVRRYCDVADTEEDFKRIADDI